MKHTILLVSNNQEIQRGFQEILGGEYGLEILINFDELPVVIREARPSLVFIDNIYEQADCSQIILNVRKQNPRLPVGFINQPNEIKSAVLVMKAGAATVVSKPLDKERLLAVISELLQYQEERKIILEVPLFFSWFLGCSPAVQALIHQLEKAAEFLHHPLLIGDPGHHFKEIGRIIHQNSLYAHQKFIHYNFNDVLSEQEFVKFFQGYVSGSADSRFIQATLCLEGIGRDNQGLGGFLSQILSKSQDEQFRNIRVIICGGRDLPDQFTDRENISFLPVIIPPLASRRMDIPFLVSDLVDSYNLKFSKNIRHVSSGVLDFFINYGWPGQTREMENVIKAAMIIQRSVEDTLSPGSLPVSLKMLFQKEVEKNIFQCIYNIPEATASCWREVSRLLLDKLGPENFVSKIFSSSE